MASSSPAGGGEAAAGTTSVSRKCRTNTHLMEYSSGPKRHGQGVTGGRGATLSFELRSRADLRRGRIWGTHVGRCARARTGGTARGRQGERQRKKQKIGSTQTETDIKEAEFESEKSLILSPPRRNDDKSHVVKMRHASSS